MKLEWFNSSMDIVAFTFDGNSFILSKAVKTGFLPNYYTVIAWDGINLYKHMLARKYFIIVQLLSPFVH